jgi:polyisoprenyl-teichoic acid--peptidoglycan teichoic acid transferase
MRLTIRLLVTLVALALPACNLPGYASVSAPAGLPAEPQAYLVGAPSNATPTATPFQPLPPTPTYLPTHTTIPPTEVPPTLTPFPEVIRDFPGPSEPAAIAIPPPVDRLKQPPGQVNILLLGSDERPEVGGLRTDVMILLTINPEEGTASLTSFPRDLYVYIPGWTMQRINTAQAHGGFETTAMTFDYNFGVRPHFYVMINFGSFISVIDSLGGIDVDVAVGLGDNRDDFGYYYVPPGVTHMDGATALWYVRSRYTTSDFDRTRRQQEVLQGAFKRLLQLDSVSRAPELFQIYRENVTTDMEFHDIAGLLPVAARFTDTSRLRHYFIGPAEVTGWITPTGAQVLLPNREAVMGIIRQAVNSP